MLVYGIAVVAALLIPLVTLGSYKRLINTEIHWGWLLGAGLAIQIGLGAYSMPRRYWGTIGFGLLVASYVLILAFCARNLILRGMSIVLIGIACNALVITLNQGMPEKLPREWRSQSWAQPTVKHHLQARGDKLTVLSDIIVVRHPDEGVISFGDLIIAVGLCDVAYNAGRNPRRRRKRRKSNGRGPARPRAPTLDLVEREAREIRERARSGSESRREASV